MNSIPMHVWFEQFRERWRQCHLCPLHVTATEHAPGDGWLVHRPVVLVGEGPGFHEDREGIPFIGPSGILLRETVDLATRTKVSEVFSTGVPIFYTNLVACRPCDNKRAPNRSPTTSEVAACEPRLYTLIRFLNPRAIIAVGFNTSDLLPERVHNEATERGGLYVIEHPASILRKGGVASPRGEKWRQSVAAAFKRIG